MYRDTDVAELGARLGTDDEPAGRSGLPVAVLRQLEVGPNRRSTRR